MLEAKGGWEVAPMERLHWMGTTPYRWTQLILDKASTGTIQGLDSASSLAISAINTIEGKLTDTSNIDSATEGATQKLIDEIIQVLRPILDQVQPITDKLVQFKNILLDDGIIANLVQTLQSYEQITEAKIRELVIPVMDSVSNAWLQIDQSVNIVDLQSRISHFFDNFLPTPEELAAIKDKSASDTATSQPSLLDKLLPKLGLTINEDSVTGDSSAEEAALQQQNQNERLSPQSNGAVSRSFESTSETERGGIVVPREDFQILKRRILESIPPPKKSTSISSSSGTDSIEKRLSSKLYSSLSASAMKSAYADVTFIEDVVGSSAQSSDTEEVQSNANRLNKVRMLLSQRQKARVSSE